MLIFFIFVRAVTLGWSCLLTNQIPCISFAPFLTIKPLFVSLAFFKFRKPKIFTCTKGWRFINIAWEPILDVVLWTNKYKEKLAFSKWFVGCNVWLLRNNRQHSLQLKGFSYVGSTFGIFLRIEFIQYSWF